MKKPNRKKTLIDLFAGAGGLSLGFSPRYGHFFEPVWANDIDKSSVETYNANFGDHCIYGDIIDILKRRKVEIPQAAVVVGGPPCQGFSLLNKNRDGDPRKQLWRPFLKIVELSGAEVFVMENVPQILGSPEHDQILRKAQLLGFKTASAKLCAADYGVPQIRWRAFIIGARQSDPNDVFPPPQTHYDRNGNGNGRKGNKKTPNLFDQQLLPWRTVRDAIYGLKQPLGTERRKARPPYDLHFGRTPTPLSMRRYAAIPEEGMNRFDLQRTAPELTPECWIRKTNGGTDLFGRLWWDRPAFTIRTEFFKPEKGRYLHPEQHRPLTHREAARIQTFPDDFLFFGTKIEIARQIGNAVPPMLASAIAGSVEKLL